MIYLFVILAGYLLGSINFAHLLCRLHGVDIFSVGSGNPGATNVTRALGGGWGKLCFTLDALKGFLAAGWPWLIGSGITLLGGSGEPVALAEPAECAFALGPGCAIANAAGSAHLLSVLGALAAITGHTCSLHLRLVTGKFKGGKAVATTMGSLAALSWPVLFSALGVWLAVYYLRGRIVALASVFFVASLPLFALGYGEHPVITWLMIFLAALVIYRHRSNLARLRQGQENTFQNKQS